MKPEMKKWVDILMVLAMPIVILSLCYLFPILTIILGIIIFLMAIGLGISVWRGVW